MRKIYLTILLFFLLSTNSFGFITFKQSKDISSDTVHLRGVTFKPDGSRMYVTSDNTTPTVIEYSLNVPFDISTATKTSETNLLVSGGAAMDKPHAIEFKPDGKVMYVIQSKSGSVGIEQFNLTTAWDTQTLSYDTSFSISDDVQIRAIAFKSDGTRVYIAQRDYGKVKQFDLSTPWNISSATNKVESNSFTGEENNLRNIQFSSDGTFMYLGGNGGDDINKYKLPTAWDISTITHETSYSISSQTGEMRGFKFTANFTKLYVTGDTADSGAGTNVVYEYSVACAGTITCNDPTNNDDVKAIIQANVELSNRIIRHNTNSIFHRIEWLRRHKNKDNLTNLNAEVDFSNEVVSNLAKGLASYKSDNRGNLNEEDWFKWSEGRVTLGKRSAINSASKDIHSYGISIGSDKIKDDDPDTMHGYVFQYNNDNVGIGSYGTKLDTNSYSFSLYGTKLRDNQVFTDGIIGIGFLDIDHKRVTFGNRLHGKRRGKQIFGSINLGKRLVDEELNFNPGIKIDLGYTELAAFREKATADSLTDELIFKKQEVITGLATIGVLLDKKVKRNDEKIINHHGRLEYIANFSPSSDATVYYANNQSTVYDYKVDNKADRNYRIGYGFDITSISGWSIVANIERFKADDIGHTNEFYLSLGYVPIDGTKFAFDLKNNESTKTGFNISKNVNGYDLKLDYENYLSQSKKGDYLANLSLHKKY